MAKKDTPEGAAVPAADADKGQRLSFQLDEHGRIAIERMRPGTVDQLRKALDASALAQLGIAGAASVAVDDGIDGAALAQILYGSASTLMVALARRSGYTSEQASVLAFQPDEVTMLAPTTGKIINKWLPTGKYQDELMLGLMLVTVVSGKLALLRKTAPVVAMVPRADVGDVPIGQ